MVFSPCFGQWALVIVRFALSGQAVVDTMLGVVLL